MDFARKNQTHNNNVCSVLVLERLKRARIKHQTLNDIKSRQSHKNNIHISFCIHISSERYGCVPAPVSVVIYFICVFFSRSRREKANERNVRNDIEIMKLKINRNRTYVYLLRFDVMRKSHASDMLVLCK